MVGHITFDRDIIETIRQRLIRWLEQHRDVKRQDLADMTGRGLDSIHKFIQGTEPSSSLAIDLCAAIPELAEGILCPFCHRMMMAVTGRQAEVDISSTV